MEGWGQPKPVQQKGPLGEIPSRLPHPPRVLTMPGQPQSPREPEALQPKQLWGAAGCRFCPQVTPGQSGMQRRQMAAYRANVQSEAETEGKWRPSPGPTPAFSPLCGHCRGGGCGCIHRTIRFLPWRHKVDAGAHRPSWNPNGATKPIHQHAFSTFSMETIWQDVI